MEPEQPHPEHRRQPRFGFELPVRCQHHTVRKTVILRDMTTHGARVDGLGPMHLDEIVTLLLPDLPPRDAWVAWSTAHSAGLEFEQPLHEDVFSQLVADFAINPGSAIAA
jgi:hypothetical protein